MPINPSNMRVVDVARLLNSTSFGFVLAQARLYREFNRVGFRIGSSENPRNINLLKYIAWMFDRKHTPEEPSGARSYEDRRNAERDRQAEAVAAQVGEVHAGHAQRDEDRPELCRRDAHTVVADGDVGVVALLREREAHESEEAARIDRIKRYLAVSARYGVNGVCE